MERKLRIYEMSEAANTASLAHSRLLNDRFSLEYAATRRGTPSASRPGGTATTTSGRLLCSLTPLW
jgi:hypothetical protein